MISVHFIQKYGQYTGVTVSGHAGYADYGQDIVCASVTSAVELTANGISEVLKLPCKVAAEKNRVSVVLEGKPDREAVHFLEALYLHLSVLAEDYPKTISILVSEV